MNTELPSTPTSPSTSGSSRAATETPVDDLVHLDTADIDALPFGYIALAEDGTIRKYNRYEADLAGTDPEQVLGQDFFREVAPCTQVKEFEGRFRRFADGELDEPTLSFDFEFRFRHGSQHVRIGFVRSPLEREIIVTVNRLRRLDLPLSPEVDAEPARGRLTDSTGAAVVLANGDLWQGLARALGGGSERREHLHRVGHEWGSRHALRLESLVQRQHGTTLREAELQVALECLSGSLGVLGLGRADIELGYRRQGLLLVVHRDRPFPSLLGDGDEHGLDPLLAGLHAGFLSYLAGRRLAGRALATETPELRIAVGTERRLERLLDPDPSRADASLLEALGVEPTGPGPGTAADDADGGSGADAGPSNVTPMRRPADRTGRGDDDRSTP